jgi:hypothetical protein
MIVTGQHERELPRQDLPQSIVPGQPLGPGPRGPV